MNRDDFRSLAQVRLSEAKVLLKAGRPDGAYYLAGYAVECALKACIARETKRYDFPDRAKAQDSHTHDLKLLVRVARLEVGRVERVKHDAEFGDNWEIVQRWSERSRYERKTLEAAKSLLDAVADSKYGVMRWIQQHW